MRKILVSGLVAATAVLGGAGAALAEAGTTGATGTAGPVTAAAKGNTAETAFRQALSGGYPADSAAVRIAASYLGQLAQPLASASTSTATTGSRISCASPTACLSIGTREVLTSTKGTDMPFAAWLHAGTWKAVPVKVPAGSTETILTDVSCTAAAYCLVVGLTETKSGVGSYAATWNGTALTPIAAPPLPAHTLGYSQAVSCVAVNSCVAIGNGGSPSGDITNTIIWTWNGATWARTVVPGTAAHVVPLYAGLRCFSLTSCVAVGHLDVAISGAGSDTPMAVAWNGTSLTSLHPGLNVGVDNSAQFNALSCVSPHSCVAVGAEDTGGSVWGSSGAFAEVWNGKTWAVTRWSGPAGDTTAVLLGVSCTSAVRCMAVGTHGTLAANGMVKVAAPAALGWNGSKWTVLKVAGPGAGKAAYFAGVSCPVNGKCLTTGATGKAGGSTAAPIAGYWNGSAWKYGPMLPAA